MNTELKELLNLIMNGSMENTYKMSWIRSIVEICEESPKKIIHFDDLSPLIFKYYWNQCIFFNLNQGQNRNKKPTIIQIVENCIRDYQVKFGYKPESFIRVQNKIKIPIQKISKVLTQDVCERFLILEKKVSNFYKPNIQKREIKISNPRFLKEYSEILYQIINYRWTQKLEETDGSPRISKKIRGVERDKTPKRGNLKLFHKFLDFENPKKICFLTGEKITGTTSVDHIIPWSYMYSDDLWNLVYVKPEENSSKSNRLPNKDLVNKLNLRNKKLLKILIKKKVKSKHIEELKISIDRDYVKKYWTGFKG